MKENREFRNRTMNIRTLNMAKRAFRINKKAKISV